MDRAVIERVREWIADANGNVIDDILALCDFAELCLDMERDLTVDDERPLTAAETAMIDEAAERHMEAATNPLNEAVQEHIRDMKDRVIPAIEADRQKEAQTAAHLRRRIEPPADPSPDLVEVVAHAIRTKLQFPSEADKTAERILAALAGRIVPEGCVVVPATPPIACRVCRTTALVTVLREDEGAVEALMGNVPGFRFPKTSKAMLDNLCDYLERDA